MKRSRGVFNLVFILGLTIWLMIYGVYYAINHMFYNDKVHIIVKLKTGQLKSWYTSEQYYNEYGLHGNLKVLKGVHWETINYSDIEYVIEKFNKFH